MADPNEETWEAVAEHPNPATDLGYEHEPLTTIPVEQDGEGYIFLPGEEDHLTDAEFLIATPEDVCWLEDWR